MMANLGIGGRRRSARLSSRAAGSIAHVREVQARGHPELTPDAWTAPIEAAAPHRRLPDGCRLQAVSLVLDMHRDVADRESPLGCSLEHVDGGQELDQQALLEHQWSHAVETARFMMGLLIQACGFLIAADSALLAFGLSKGRHPALYIAAAMPLLMAVVALVISYAASPVIYTALVTEKHLDPPAPLITRFAEHRAPSFVASLKRMDPQLSGAIQSGLPRVVFRRAMIFWITIAGAVAQLAVAVGFSLS